MSESPKLLTVDGTECILHVGNYPASKLAMSLALTEITGEPYAVMSVNLGNYQQARPDSFVPKGSTYLDTNNCPWVEQLIADNGLGEQRTSFGTPQYGASGYCEYPLYDLNISKLAEYDPEGVQAYSTAWNVACAKEQQRLINGSVRQNFECDDDFEDDYNPDYGE